MTLSLWEAECIDDPSVAELVEDALPPDYRAELLCRRMALDIEEEMGIAE